MNLSSRKQRDNLSTVSDGYTRILPLSTNDILLDKPILIAGFPDSGMIGSVSINHIIEQLGMHQIACVESQYVMPAAIFIGKKFRHPFRIYANDSGTVCALVCEVPVISRGTPSIINTIVDWSINSRISEIIVLGGILPSNFSPAYLHDRRALLLSNELIESSSKRVLPTGQQHTTDDSYGMVTPDDAVIIGLSGSLLSVCATHDLKCKALMIPTMSEAPDPEGAAIVLEALVKILPGLKIDTSALRQKAEIIKKHLEEFLKMHQPLMHEYERVSSRPETERIYK